MHEPGFKDRELVYLTPRQAIGIYLSQKGRCLYCQEKLTADNLTVEHVVPRCWGGPARALWNIALTCQGCNLRKGLLEGGPPEERQRPILKRLPQIYAAMLAEATQDLVVQRMVNEIKRRLDTRQAYNHQHLPEGEAGDGLSSIQGYLRVPDSEE